MNCNEIFKAALALIGEPEHNNSTVDYAERAERLFFLVLTKYRTLSTALDGIDHKSHTLFITSLDINYPLDQKTIAPATYSLASLLIQDELPELSEQLEKKAAEAAAEIAKEAGCAGPITEVY